jgi:hypothetical protein
MTKTKRVLFVVSILSLLVLTGAGCGGGVTNAPGGTQPENVNQTQGQPQGQTQTEGDLAQILGESKGITNYSYDQTITIGNETIASTVYRKDQKMRQETNVGGQKVVMYLDLATGEIYSYTPATKQAIKLNSGQAQNSEPIDQVSEKIDPTTKILGEETLNGEETVVVQETVDNNVEKIWISKKYGLPIKIEAQSPTGTMTTEIKNLKVGGVTDADVTLPPEANVMEMPNLPSMPNIGQ